MGDKLGRRFHGLVGKALFQDSLHLLYLFQRAVAGSNWTTQTSGESRAKAGDSCFGQSSLLTQQSAAPGSWICGLLQNRVEMEVFQQWDDIALTIITPLWFGQTDVMSSCQDIHPVLSNPSYLLLFQLPQKVILLPCWPEHPRSVSNYSGAVEAENTSSPNFTFTQKY